MLKKRHLEGQPSGVSIHRTSHGVPKVEGETEADIYWGFGYAHARDRGLQMLFMRILGQGRLSEILDSSDEALEIDTFFRKMNWHRHQKSPDELSPRAQKACQAYIEGINGAFRQSVPWELRILGYQHEEWVVNDSYLLARMISFLTLAQSQGELERLIIQMAQHGLSEKKLKALFGRAIEGIDLELIGRVKLGENLVPPSVKWVAGNARLMASNNWVISGENTRSGQPLLGSDPHLEINRLPAVWQEIILKQGEKYALAATMPGIPGLVIGRTKELSWGPTYTFMDTVDSWVEQCKDGLYKSQNDFKPFVVRTEKILRKNKPMVEVRFFENEHGVLEGDPFQDEYLLCTRWSSAQAGPRSINQMIEMWDAQTVEQGMDIIGKLEPSFNWVLADTQGNIGYQMSGLMPRRKEGWSGLYPIAGWKTENNWDGFVEFSDLPRALNPEEGFFVTANQNLNAFGKVDAINACQGDYRSRRISELIKQQDQWTTQSSQSLQMDTYSLQAEDFFPLIEEALTDDGNGKILREWNKRYDADSTGAFLFEVFYREFRRLSFGANGLSTEVMDFLESETGVLADFFINFDQVMLEGSEDWFDSLSRKECLQQSLDKALRSSVRPWSCEQKLEMKHILFGDKLPRWLGFDHAPFTLLGGRATPHQGQIFRSGSRTTSFAPSIRFITDMAENSCLSCLIGGPSDRRFSRWYKSEVKSWLAGDYKLLTPED